MFDIMNITKQERIIKWITQQLTKKETSCWDMIKPAKNISFGIKQTVNGNGSNRCRKHKIISTP